MLRRPGRPLAGYDVTFKHHVYDWNDPSPLASLVEEAIGRHEVVAASSEGGLFEYGDDEISISNLAALQGKPIVGSVTNGDALRRRMIAAGKFKLHPRDREEFARIAAAAGYQLRRSEPGPISCQVALGAL